MKRRLLDPEWQPWWKQFLKVLLGANLAALLKAVRWGPLEGWKSSVRSFDACDPLKINVQEAWALYTQIPEVKLVELLDDSRIPIKLVVQGYEDGMLPMEHAIALLALAVKENPPVLLEIGTFCGHTTKLLAQNLAKSTIHTIDLPEDYIIGSDSANSLQKDDHHLIAKRIVGREYYNQAGSERIVQHWGDTAEWDFSLAKNASFFFIDGAHTYDYVKNDSEKCFALCSGKGVFLWHDCDPDHFGVLRFLKEWRDTNGREIVRIHGTSLAYFKAT